jgi:hypothetical protein
MSTHSGPASCLRLESSAGLIAFSKMKWTTGPPEEGERPASLSRFDPLHSQMYHKLWVLIGNAVVRIIPGESTVVGLPLIYTQVAVFEGSNPMNEIFLHPFVIA